MNPNNTNLSSLEEKINVTFKNKNLLLEALTHRSYINENAKWPVFHNERLEYLGDAVLELCTSEYLFKKYPDRPEGELTTFRAALVNYQMLGNVAHEIKLEEYIFLSKGESKETGKSRDVISADALEALIGAIYLDQGYEKAREFTGRFVLSHLDEVVSKGLYRDPKSALQELVQEKLKLTPTYEILKESGPDHEKKFRAGVFFGKERAAEGLGTSKQEAESNAAQEALKKMESDS